MPGPDPIKRCVIIYPVYPKESTIPGDKKDHVFILISTLNPDRPGCDLFVLEDFT